MQRLGFRGDVLENSRNGCSLSCRAQVRTREPHRADGQYRNRAWLATGGLIAFTLLYFALSGWFAWTAWRLFNAALTGQFETRWGWFAAFGAAFLAVFMIKALLFVQHRYSIEAVELKRDEQPRFFEFLDRLADDAGAPRAHRVFVSGHVNAAVFYDLSLLNLIVPSKKNLEIGLALVNGLTLGELKAVLAHEFGHFAQRSMAVGRWFYVAQQIADQIIARRDMLDRFLDSVHVVLSLIVWSIRSLTETAFRLVLLAQRALSREMEFQADLVAVSVTGSDALVHALHKISFAEYAWDQAAGFAASEAQAGRLVRDVFALQTEITQRMREVLDDPAYGAVEEVPRLNPELHRVFKQQLAQAPRMWSTHPSNNEREENAKRTYVPAAIDDRSAWGIFDNAAALRERISAELFRAPPGVEPETEATEQAAPAEQMAPAPPTAEAPPLDESRQRLNQYYRRTHLDPKYRGAYLSRTIARHATRAEELYDSAGEPAADIASLYPEPLAEDLKLLREIETERAALEALRDGFMEAPGGVIRHRGKELQRRDLPKAIETLDTELAVVQARLRAHDRRCRSAHLAVAKTLGYGWPEYLSTLLAMVHYAEHSEADLLDAHGALHGVLAIVMAEGHVTNTRLQRLLAACEQTWIPLQRVYEQAKTIALGAPLGERMAVDTWDAGLAELKLVAPTKDNIGDWLGAFDGWVGHTAAALSALRLAALDELLLAERRVAEVAAGQTHLTAAPEPASAPAEYPVLLPGAERPRQKQLGIWHRFRVADGPWATAARLVVAVAIAGSVMGVSMSIGESKLSIFNALDRTVSVTVADSSVEVPPFTVRTTQLLPGDVHVTTTFLDGRLVEEFDELERPFAHVVYNVAAAAPLLLWGEHSSPRVLTAERWTTSTTRAFSPFPRYEMSKSGEVSGPGAPSPHAWLAMLPTELEAKRLIDLHGRLSSSDGSALETWLRLAAQSGQLATIAASRLAAEPHDITTLYVEQRVAGPEPRAVVCGRHTALARAHPGDGDYRYLADSCIPGSIERGAAYVASFKEHPDSGWLAFAAGSEHAQRARWDDAVAALELARRTVPVLADDAALTLARVRRMTMDQPQLIDLARDSPAVRGFLNVEYGEPQEPLEQAYRALHLGDPDGAAAAGASLDGFDAARLLRLAAASDGASAELVQRALRLPHDGSLDPTTVFAFVGLLLREDHGPQDIPDVVRMAAPQHTEKVLEVVEAIQARDVRRVDEILEIADPAVRGQFYALATVALGNETPNEWREYARRLLFATERPYFAPGSQATDR